MDTQLHTLTVFVLMSYSYICVPSQAFIQDFTAGGGGGGGGLNRLKVMLA